MKTKKISWQAIAIVVLALVLIASIALGVSGAWFQDADSVSQTSTMGDPVQIRLAKTETDMTYGEAKNVETWANKYKTKSTQVYPGDTIMGATTIINSTATPMVVRMTLDVTVTSDDYDAEQTTEPEAVAKPNWNDADYSTKIAAYNTYANKYNSYLLNNLINTAMAEADKEESSHWTPSADKKYYYYNSIVAASGTAIKVFDELKLDTKLTNECTGWEIKVELKAEAIQAANLSENTDWYSAESTGSTMPSGLRTLVETHNGESGRLQPKS